MNSVYFTTYQTGQFNPNSRLSDYECFKSFSTDRYVDIYSFYQSGLNFANIINDLSGDLSNKLYLTGVDIISLINSNSVGISSINGRSGIINLSGIGNIFVQNIGNTIYFSGNSIDISQFYTLNNPYNYSTSGNVQNTGIALQLQINNLDNKINIESGYWSKNPSGFITSNQ